MTAFYSCFLLGVLVAAFGSFMPAWVYFTRQFDAPPNIADFAYFVQSGGFKVAGLLFWGANSVYNLSIFCTLCWTSVVYSHGSLGPTFPLGTWSAPNVPPSHAELARLTVALCVIYGWFIIVPATNQFYHMWNRCDGRYVLSPPKDMSKGFLLIQEPTSERRKFLEEQLSGDSMDYPGGLSGVERGEGGLSGASSPSGDSRSPARRLPSDGMPRESASTARPALADVV